MVHALEQIHNLLEPGGYLIDIHPNGELVEFSLPLEEGEQFIGHMQETDDYIGLPSKFDIDDYSIMERFCLSIDDSEISDTLYGLIKGSGAFRRFKDALYEYNLSDDWYKFRNNALKEIAIEWCQENGIEFEEK